MSRHTTYDVTVTKEVRTKALGDILEVLNETAEASRFGEYKKQMLLKLANTVLPRISEHSGIGGSPINIQLSEAIAKKNGIAPQAK